MDFSYPAEVEQFRAELRDWLSANLTPELVAARRPAGPDDATFELLRAWNHTMADARWAAVSWPSEYWGRGATVLCRSVKGEDTMGRLQDKVVIISGGARGQGAAEARLVVAEGGKAVIGDVLEAEGRRLADELGSNAVFLRQDVTEEADWAKAVEAAQSFGGLHGTVRGQEVGAVHFLLE